MSCCERTVDVSVVIEPELSFAFEARVDIGPPSTWGTPVGRRIRIRFYEVL